MLFVYNFFLTPCYFVQYLHGIAERTEDLVAPPRGEHGVGCHVIISAASQGEECRVTPSEDEAAQEPLKYLKRTTRYSLTIRHVPNTSKLKIKLGRWDSSFFLGVYFRIHGRYLYKGNLEGGGNDSLRRHLNKSKGKRFVVKCSLFTLCIATFSESKVICRDCLATINKAAEVGTRYFFHYSLSMVR